MTKYFVDEQGNYLGGFDGAEPPDGAIEVPNPPDRGLKMWNGAEFVAPAVDLGALKATLIVDVDSSIAGIYAKWTRFESEYVEREAAARAFKDGGYLGTPSAWISDFATPAGMSTEAATDLIIEQADTLRAALKSLGAQRMRKYEILSAADPEAAQAAHDDIIAQADAIAATLS